MRFILGFLIGAVLGAAGHWYLAQHPNSTVAVGPQRPEAVEVSPSERGTNAVSTGDGRARTEELKDELARTGRVIREKAQEAGGALASVAENTRVSATIKTKLLEDRGLSAFAVDVDTADGVVTLSGTVDSPAAIDRAMELALNTDGVRKVISTLQLKPK